MTPFGLRRRLRTIMGGAPGADQTTGSVLPCHPVVFQLPDETTFTADAKRGDNLVNTSNRGPMAIATGCSDCTCGNCEVEVLGGADQLSPADGMEKRTMAANEIAPERRLGCQAQVLGDGVKVRIVNVFGFDAT